MTGSKTRCLRTELKKIVKNIRSRVSASIKKAFLEVYSVPADDESDESSSSDLWWTLVMAEIERVDIESSDKTNIVLHTSSQSEQNPPDFSHLPVEWTECGLYLEFWNKLGEYLKDCPSHPCINVLQSLQPPPHITSVTVGPPMFECFVQSYVRHPLCVYVLDLNAMPGRQILFPRQ